MNIDDEGAAAGETGRGFFIEPADNWQLPGAGSTASRRFDRGWPLFEPRGRFELGSIFDCHSDALTDFAVSHALGRNRSGWWECDLADDGLTWTSGVYEIFGLPQGARIARGEAIALYGERSRAAVEKLRSHAIMSRTGFILDAEIRPAAGDAGRWMRLIAAPVVEEDRGVRLHGLKLRI